MNIELLKQLAEKAQEDHKALRLLKETAVRAKQFEFAAQLREIERTKFPETAEQKAAKEDAKNFVVLFGMVGLKISEDTAWLLYHTVKQHSKMRNKFDLKTASELIAKTKEFFIE